MISTKQFFHFIEHKRLLSLLQVLPIFILFFSMLGLAQTLVFYAYFHINILRFISLGEILTSFSWDVIFMSFFLVAVFITVNSFRRVTVKNYTINYTEMPSNFKINKLLIRYPLKRLTIVIIILAVLHISLLFMPPFRIAMFTNESTSFLIVTYYSSYVFIFITERAKYFGKPIAWNLGILLSVTCLFFAFKLGTASISRVTDESKAQQNRYEVQMDNGKLFVTNTDTIYLGQTTSTLFLYDLRKARPIHFNMSHVVSVTSP